MMSVNEQARELLGKAADLIEERGLCKHSFAEDRSGCEVSAGSRKAYRFCAKAALTRLTDDRLVLFAATRMVERHAGMPIVAWNDHRKTEATTVARVFRKLSSP